MSLYEHFEAAGDVENFLIPDIRKVQGGLENSYADAVKTSDKALAAMLEGGDSDGYANAVNTMGASIAKNATDAYRDLAGYLFVKYMDGNVKKTDENGDFIKSEYGLPVYPTFPGYDKRYYEQIVKESGDHFLIK